MDLQGIIVLIILVILVIVLLKFLFGLVFILPFYEAHGAIQIVSPRATGACAVYNICLNVSINGHTVPATLDTGTDYTLIPPSYAQQLGLTNLPTSSIIGMDVPFSGIGGQSQTLHSVNVLMSIEGHKAFYTGVLLNQSDNPPIILLSLHDFYQNYRVTFTPIK